MINSRNESEKDAELSRLYNYKIRNTKKPNFLGSVSRRKPTDDKSVYLNLSCIEEKKADKPPEGNTYNKGLNSSLDTLNTLKEFDLLLLSREK